MKTAISYKLTYHKTTSFCGATIFQQTQTALFYHTISVFSQPTTIIISKAAIGIISAVYYLN